MQSFRSSSRLLLSLLSAPFVLQLLLELLAAVTAMLLVVVVQRKEGRSTALIYVDLTVNVLLFILQAFFHSVYVNLEGRCCQKCVKSGQVTVRQLQQSWYCVVTDFTAAVIIQLLDTLRQHTCM